VNAIGFLALGFCLGTLAGYMLHSQGKSSITTLTHRQIPIAPVDVYVQEASTGRIVLGGTVNSDLGVAGQLIIDERALDYRR
jgi:hypothetical protein